MDEQSDVFAPSGDAFVKLLSSMLEKDLASKGTQFSIQGADLAGDEIAAHNGLLPIMLHKAALIYADMFGKKMPLAFEVNKKALCEAIPLIEEAVTLTDGEGGEGDGDGALLPPFSVYAHCLHAAVEGLEREAKASREQTVKLDDLYQDWFSRLQKSEYKVIPPRQDSLPTQTGPRGDGRSG